MLKKILLPCIASLLFFSACKKDPEVLDAPPVSDFAPLEVGKYITYQLDSVRYIPFTLQQITISYEVKVICYSCIHNKLCLVADGNLL